MFENRCHREPHCQCKKCRQCFQPIGELTTKVRKTQEAYTYEVVKMFRNPKKMGKVLQFQTDTKIPKKYSKAHE